MDDIVGKKFSKLAVICKSEKRDSGGAVLYKCICDCGKETYVPKRYLKSGHTKSCGCTRKEKFKKYVENLKGDLTNRKFGKLTAIRCIGSNSNGKAMWLCKCDCGKEKEIVAESLISGNTQSCGCISINILEREKDKNLAYGTNTAIIKGIVNNNKSDITKSGVKGVCWDDKRKKWRVYICFQGKNYHLGYFEDKEVAIQTRKIAEEKLFIYFLNWYEERKNDK